MEIDILKGKIITQINESKDSITFISNDNERFIMYHSQECCESVYIEDIVGDLDDLINSEILEAEESSNIDTPKDSGDESFTWTFYKLGTIKGNVTIRWYGTSNGYYSESVSFEKIES